MLLFQKKKRLGMTNSPQSPQYADRSCCPPSYHVGHHHLGVTAILSILSWEKAPIEHNGTYFVDFIGLGCNYLLTVWQLVCPMSARLAQQQQNT